MGEQVNTEATEQLSDKPKKGQQKVQMFYLQINLMSENLKWRRSPSYSKEW